MGYSKLAAVAAALSAVVLIAYSCPTGSMPGNERSESRSDTPDSRDIQTRNTLRGQAWGTELFGRRWGRNLLAAVTPDSEDRDIGA